jgi:hypothetical protein
MSFALLSAPLLLANLASARPVPNTVNDPNPPREPSDKPNETTGADKISTLATFLRESKSTGTSASEAAQKSNAVRRTYPSDPFRFGTMPIGGGKKGEQFVINLPASEIKGRLSATARPHSGLVHIAVEIIDEESSRTINGKKHQQGQSSRVFLSPDAFDMGRTDQTVRLVITALTDFKGLNLHSSLVRTKQPNPTAAQPERPLPNETVVVPMARREVGEGVIEHHGWHNADVQDYRYPEVLLANGQKIRARLAEAFPTRVKEVSLTSLRSTLPVSGLKGELIVAELPPPIARQLKEGIRFELQHKVDSGEVRTQLWPWNGKWYLVATADTDYRDLTMNLADQIVSRCPQREPAK